MLVQFGFSPFKMKKAEVIATLNNFLIEQYAAGRKVLLIVDEAQNLIHRVLEEIRMLSGVETTKEKVLRIILAGQPELNEKLELAGAGAARPARPPALSSDGADGDAETAAYIDHRLEVAGSQGRRIFDEDTYSVDLTATRAACRASSTRCATRA